MRVDRQEELVHTHGFAECVGDQVVFMVLNLVQLLGLISTFEPFLVLSALHRANIGFHITFHIPMCSLIV